MIKGKGRPNTQQKEKMKVLEDLALKIDIDAEVLSAKLGNKNAFNKLWQLYRPVIVRNIDSFCNLSKGFEQYRHVLLSDSYVYFWDIINDYDFGSDIPFSYYVYDGLLEKTKQKVKGNKLLPSELINDEKLRSFRGFRSQENRDKLKELREIMKKFSTKQLQAVYVYHYLGHSSEVRAGKILNISSIGFRRRLKQCYNKIRKNMKKLLWSRLSDKEKRAIRKLRRMRKCH